MQWWSWVGVYPSPAFTNVDIGMVARRKNLLYTPENDDYPIEELKSSNYRMIILKWKDSFKSFRSTQYSNVEM